MISAFCALIDVFGVLPLFFYYDFCCATAVRYLDVGSGPCSLAAIRAHGVDWHRLFWSIEDICLKKGGTQARTAVLQ